MARGVKSTSKKLETSLYHHVLTKLLVVYELNKRGSIQKQFITQYFTLEGTTTIHIEGTPKFVGKGRKGKGSKESKENLGSSENEKKQPSSEAEDIGDSISKSVNKPKQKKEIKVAETPESRVKT